MEVAEISGLIALNGDGDGGLNPMKQVVAGFEKDEAGHWMARLECGHNVHVRHDPPWTEREWVTREEGRAERIGRVMECKRCDQDAAGD